MWAKIVTCIMLNLVSFDGNALLFTKCMNLTNSVIQWKDSFQNVTTVDRGSIFLSIQLPFNAMTNWTVTSPSLKRGCIPWPHTLLFHMFFWLKWRQWHPYESPFCKENQSSKQSLLQWNGNILRFFPCSNYNSSVTLSQFITVVNRKKKL